ncbi:MAG: aspartate kinase [Rikenellaceae bacterium]|nr:aspartate kinase [Rikenellaceae bacterium]
MGIVLKFGGTSVGSAANMRRVASIIKDERATVTVLSAMSGTTDALVKTVVAASEGDAATVKEQLEMLRRKYSTCIAELLTVNAPQALERMEASFGVIERQAAAFECYTSERTIISQGELLTSAIFTLHLLENGVKAVLLNAPDFMRTDDRGKVDTAFLREKLETLTSDGDTYYITQGFICANHRGEVDNLGRGGSDYSAALIGAAIGGSEVQIWTDIDGMHNNDPRFVTNTYPIRRMSFDEAAELAYFGAKILHPATIQPCKELGIPVLLRNTMEPSAPGTTISDDDDSGRDFHAVAAKDGITVIRIHSTRMLMAYGFLRQVFEVFERHRTPIDMITTSEVAVSLTVDNDSCLEEIVAELRTLGSIEVERDNSIVCVVGNIGYDKLGLAAHIFDSIAGVPVKMISYGASHRSIVVLIDTRFKRQTLQSLNDHLF